MISVVVYKSADKITMIDITGHSGYDKSGKDIVCSAVSTAVWVSGNLLKKLNKDVEIEEDQSLPRTTLKVNSMDELTEVILDNLVETINEISNDFKNYLKIKIK